MNIKTKRNIDKRAIIFLVVFMAIVAIIFTTWIYVILRDLNDAAEPEQTQVPVTSNVIDQPGYSKVALQEIPAVEQEVPVEAPVIVASEPLAQPEPQSQYVSPLAGYMTEVGIAPEDQPIAEALANANGEWTLTGCMCREQVIGFGSTQSKFIALRNYVNKIYGSFPAAQAQAAKGVW